LKLNACSRFFFSDGEKEQCEIWIEDEIFFMKWVFLVLRRRKKRNQKMIKKKVRNSILMKWRKKIDNEMYGIFKSN
jgi:hypothetical protein